MKHFEPHTAGMPKLEDVHAAEQKEHTMCNEGGSGRANMAAEEGNRGEGVGEHEESIRLVMWRMDKDMWAAAAPADTSRRLTVAHMSSRWHEVVAEEDHSLADSKNVGLRVPRHRPRPGVVYWIPNKPQVRKADMIGTQ